MQCLFCDVECGDHFVCEECADMKPSTPISPEEGKDHNLQLLESHPEWQLDNPAPGEEPTIFDALMAEEMNMGCTDDTIEFITAPSESDFGPEWEADNE